MIILIGNSDQILEKWMSGIEIIVIGGVCLDETDYDFLANNSGPVKLTCFHIRDQHLTSTATVDSWSKKIKLHNDFAKIILKVGLMTFSRAREKVHLQKRRWQVDGVRDRGGEEERHSSIFLKCLANSIDEAVVPV